MALDVITLDGDGWQFKGYVGEDWLWRNPQRADTRDTLGWLPGRVPGSVQHDLWRAGEIPDPYVGRNSLLIEWVPARTWVYKRSFAAPVLQPGQRARLRLAGVDYSARFYLNGDPLGSHTGLFTPAVFDVTDRLQPGADNLLAVVIDPAPAEQPQVGYSSRVRTHKPRMTYWWDFCPRMIHLGIWDHVTLEITGPAILEDVYVRPVLAHDFQQAQVRVQTGVSVTALLPAVIETVLLYEGRPVARARRTADLQPGLTTVTETLDLDHPHLWWPNGHGGQPLYEAQVRVWPAGDRAGTPSDSTRTTFGVRQIELVPNDTPDATALPYTLLVNGQKIFARGWNWVPLDVLYGVERPARLERVLTLARRANVNLLRVWGGGLIEKTAFYDLCDRYGLLIWQEFPQSSSGIENRPPDDPDFVAEMARLAEEVVPLRRNHPALALWCGGNELQDGPEQPSSDRAPMLAALHAVVSRLDPGRAWLPTSSSGRVFLNSLDNIARDPDGLHDVHGPWEHQGLVDQYTLYNAGTSLLHSEFGVEGATDLATIEHILPPADRWPVARSNPAWFHTAAWWLREETLARAFGPLLDLPTTVSTSQFLQAEGLRYAVESDRRRQWRCSGTLPWQFNEPYPNVYGTPAVGYYTQARPAYYTVARAYRSLAISARFARQAWGPAGSPDGGQAGGPAMGPGAGSGGADGARFAAEAWAVAAGDGVQNAISEHAPGRPVPPSRSGKGVRGLGPAEANTAGEVSRSCCHLVARLIGSGGRVYGEQTDTVELPINAAARMAEYDWPLAELAEDIFFLDLCLLGADSRPLATNRYPFSRTDNLAPLLSLPATSLWATAAEMDEDTWRVTLRNAGSAVAFGTWLADARPLDTTPAGPAGSAYFADNYFYLLPDETVTVRVDWHNVPRTARSLSVSAWNAPRLLIA